MANMEQHLSEFDNDFNPETGLDENLPKRKSIQFFNPNYVGGTTSGATKKTATIEEPCIRLATPGETAAIAGPAASLEALAAYAAECGFDPTPVYMVSPPHLLDFADKDAISKGLKLKTRGLLRGTPPVGKKTRKDTLKRDPTRLEYSPNNGHQCHRDTIEQYVYGTLGVPREGADFTFDNGGRPLITTVINHINPKTAVVIMPSDTYSVIFELCKQRGIKIISVDYNLKNHNKEEFYAGVLEAIDGVVASGMKPIWIDVKPGNPTNDIYGEAGITFLDEAREKGATAILDGYYMHHADPNKVKVPNCEFDGATDMKKRLLMFGITKAIPHAEPGTRTSCLAGDRELIKFVNQGYGATKGGPNDPGLEIWTRRIQEDVLMAGDPTTREGAKKIIEAANTAAEKRQFGKERLEAMGFTVFGNGLNEHGMYLYCELPDYIPYNMVQEFDMFTPAQPGLPGSMFSTEGSPPLTAYGDHSDTNEYRNSRVVRVCIGAEWDILMPALAAVEAKFKEIRARKREV